MNFNNMNRYGTGATEGTFGAEGTFGGDCDRNKLGQLLAANIAALLNKKSESESESESERKSGKSITSLVIAQALASASAPIETDSEAEREKIQLVQIQVGSIAQLLNVERNEINIPFNATTDEIIEAVRPLAFALNLPIP